MTTSTCHRRPDGKGEGVIWNCSKFGEKRHFTTSNSTTENQLIVPNYKCSISPVPTILKAKRGHRHRVFLGFYTQCNITPALNSWQSLCISVSLQHMQLTSRQSQFVRYAEQLRPSEARDEAQQQESGLTAGQHSNVATCGQYKISHWPQTENNLQKQCNGMMQFFSKNICRFSLFCAYFEPKT